MHTRAVVTLAFPTHPFLCVLGFLLWVINRTSTNDRVSCGASCVLVVISVQGVEPCVPCLLAYFSCRHCPFPRHFDVNAKDLVRRLLTADKTKRIGCLRGGAEDIKAHKWFERLSWDAVLRCTLPVPFTPKVSPLWFTDMICAWSLGFRLPAGVGVWSGFRWVVSTSNITR